MRGEDLTADLFGPRVAPRHRSPAERYIKAVRPDLSRSLKNESRALYVRVFYLRRVGISVYRAGGRMHLVGGVLMSNLGLRRVAIQRGLTKEGLKMAARLLGFSK